jgi:hypothetical protein
MASAMNRSPANRSPAHRSIDIDDPEEVWFWCREFDVMPLELISAVVAVGPRLDDVKQKLARIPMR